MIHYLFLLHLKNGRVEFEIYIKDKKVKGLELECKLTVEEAMR